jgi:hypothetical protein
MLAHRIARSLLLALTAARALGCAGPDVEPGALPALERTGGKADEAAAGATRYLFRRDAAGKISKARIAPDAPPPGGPRVAAESGAALDFLRRSQRAFELDPAVIDMLRPAALEVADDTVAVAFEQQWDGLPLLEAGVRVVYHQSGEVETVNLAPVRSAAPPAARHALTPAAAAEAAVTAAGGGEATQAPDVRAGWVVVRGQLRPAYAVELTLGDPPDSWRYVIDGRSGEVLVSTPLRSRLTGHGRVWAHNSWVDKETTTVELPRLDTGAKLAGTYVKVYAKNGAPAAGADGVFNYPPTDRRFAQVMAYAHLDALAAYADALGFKTRLRPIPVYVNSFAELNAYYDGVTGGLYFGFDQHYRTADDADALHHELGHALVDHAAPWLMRADTKYEAALHEGYADYLACSFAADPYVAEALMQALFEEYGMEALASIDFDPRHPGRRCDTARRWPRDVDADPHVTGLIVSAALWDLRTAAIQATDADIGPKTADRLALSALKYLGDRGNDPQDVLEALLTADRRLKTGLKDAITAAFAQHGIKTAG